MQKDFLALVPAYCAAVSPSVRARRAALVVWLSEDYRFRRGHVERAVKDISGKAGTVSTATIHADTAVYRTAYRFLKGDDHLREEMKKDAEAGVSPQFTGVRALIKEGIDTWEKLEARCKPVPHPKPQPAPVSAANVHRALQQLQEAVCAFLADAEAKGRKLHEAEAALAEKDRELAMVKEALSGEHVARLRQIATESSATPELTTIAERLEEEIESVEHHGLELLGRLPNRYQWPNDEGAIRYERNFLKAVARFSPDEQNQVVAALGKFSQDFGYPGLQSKRAKQTLPYTPVRSMMSRAAGDLRFSWKKSEAVATIYWAWRRGDSRTGQSES